MKTKFWIVVFNHKHGTDAWTDWRDDCPRHDEIFDELIQSGVLEKGEMKRYDTYIDIFGPQYVPGFEPKTESAEDSSRRNDVKSMVMDYIRSNMRSGVRVTNIESMFINIGIKFADPIYLEKEEIVCELIRDGHLVTYTEKWRDYCWLIPSDIDHISMFPDTAAIVRCHPFGYGMNGPWPPLPGEEQVDG